MKSDFIGRRWLEFRIGHGTYLMFAIGFVNFISIQHGLVETINKNIPLWLFSLLVLAVLVPIAIVIGRLHQKKQFATESVYQTNLNPYTFKIVPKSKEEVMTKAMICILKSLPYSKENQTQIESLQNILDGQDTRTN